MTASCEGSQPQPDSALGFESYPPSSETLLASTLNPGPTGSKYSRDAIPHLISPADLGVVVVYLAASKEVCISNRIE